jgi:predicted ATPase
MKLINKISIKYFRSLHSVEIKNVRDLNVITGRNDVGKSNVLKALNLFFNGQTDWESAYNFYDNFSKKRLEEVRQESVKGKQFISIKIDFTRPENFKNSLPISFSVERKWHRDSPIYIQSDNLAYLEKLGKLPSSITTAQRSLAKLLNRIHFEYVPAIKDRAYINNLLGRLQRALLDSTIEQDKTLMATAKNLASHIEAQIDELRSDFQEATSIQTMITPPTNISSLFQSFLVSTNTDDGSIPLIFRGDGLQSRYIASVLNYIAVKSKNVHIWGYEEPEIALEYSHASKLANDFKDSYSKYVQIFTTSHSPAFIAIEGENIATFRTSQENLKTSVSNIELIGKEAKHKINEELGIMEIQKEIHKIYMEKSERLRENSDRVRILEKEIEVIQTPLVVTEGKTDSKIISSAAKILQINEPIRFRECNNSGSDKDIGGAGTLAKLIESVHPQDNRIVVALFDNDDEGQKEFSNLSKNFKKVEEHSNIKRHINDMAWAMLLPEPSFREGYVAAKNLTIEYMFEDDVLSRKFQSGRSLTFKAPPLIIKCGQLELDITPEMENQLKIQSDKSRKIDVGKNEFADEIVPLLTPDKFIAFHTLFDQLRWIIRQ